MRRLAQETFVFVFAVVVFQPLLLAQDDGGIPMGMLGHKLGSYLTIEGACPSTETKSGNMLVDTVNGKKLDKPLLIWVENMLPLPKGVSCEIRGYESGKMIGIPDEVSMKEKIPQEQPNWRFHRYFIATSVVHPKNLKITR